MRKLTDQQEAFCHAYVGNGGKPRPAAILAGYAQESASGTAQRLLSLEHVQKRLQELVLERLVYQAPMLLKSLVKLATSAKSESVRLGAINSLLDRGAVRMPEHQAEGRTVEVDLATLLARAAQLADELKSDRTDEMGSHEEDPPGPPNEVHH